MARIIRVGGSSSSVSWHEALKDLRADDVLMLGPGYYYLPQGITLTDITITTLFTELGSQVMKIQLIS